MSKRPMIAIAAGVILAMLAACYLQAAVLLLSIAAILLFALSFLLRRRMRIVGVFRMAALGFLIGTAAWTIYHAVCYAPAAEYDDESGVLTAIVAQYPEVYEDYTAVIVDAETLDEKALPHCKILLYLDGTYESLMPGDRVSARIKLSVPESRWNYDRFRTYRAKGIYLTASCDKEDPAIEITAQANTLRYLPIRVTDYCVNRLQALCSEKSAAVLAALIFGDERGLSEDYVAALRRSGLSHITAVSGMNVAFLVGLLLAIFRRRAGSILAVPAVIFFVLMTGGSASIVRAGIMQLLWLLAYFVNRESDPLNSLFLAVGLILLGNPFAIADVGLWLSFSATLGLVLFASKLQHTIMTRIPVKARIPRRILDLFVSAFCTTIAAQVFVIPIQIIVFGDLSLISPIANVLVVPITEYAFTFGLAALLLSLLWLPLGHLLIWIPDLLVRFQLFVVPILAKLPLAAVSMDHSYMKGFVVVSYFLAFLRIRKKPRLLLLRISCILLAAIAAFSGLALQSRLTAELVIADTSGSQSVIAADSDAVVVINCGGSYESACRTVEDELYRMGRDRISLFVLTDYRSASAGNAETLLTAYPVDTLVLPETGDEDELLRRAEILATAEAQGTKVVLPEEMTSYQAGSVTCRIMVNAEPGSDQGRLMAVVETAGYRTLALGSVRPENAAYLLSVSGLDKLHVIAAGDYYASRMVPPAALSLRPEYCVFSSYAGADREVLTRTVAQEITAIEMESMGYLRIRVPRLYGSAKTQTGFPES